jgi:hypothetical protein
VLMRMTGEGPSRVKTRDEGRLQKIWFYQKLVESRSACEEGFRYPLFCDYLEFSHGQGRSYPFSQPLYKPGLKFREAIVSAHFSSSQ